MKTRYFLFETDLKYNPRDALRKYCNRLWYRYSCNIHKWFENHGYKNFDYTNPDGYKEITEEEAFRYILEN